MKYILLICFCISTQIAFSQIFKVSTANKMLTSDMSVNEAKKLLSLNYNFTGDGGTSAAGNTAYNFESKSASHYDFVFLYSSAFDRIGYIQFYDDIKQAMNYRKQILELDFKYIDTKFSEDGTTRAFGYRKGKLLYVVELGVRRGQCKVHLSNEDF